VTWTVDVSSRTTFVDVVVAAVVLLSSLSEHDAVADRVRRDLERRGVAEVDERHVDALPRRGAQQPRTAGRAGPCTVRDGARQVPAAAAAAVVVIDQVVTEVHLERSSSTSAATRRVEAREWTADRRLSHCIQQTPIIGETLRGNWGPRPPVRGLAFLLPPDEIFGECNWTFGVKM